MYLTLELGYALIYSLGYSCSLGYGHGVRPVPEPVINRDGRYGYLFEFDPGLVLSQAWPDEDIVGGAVYVVNNLTSEPVAQSRDRYIRYLLGNPGLLRLLDSVAKDRATRLQYSRACAGDWRYYACVGKKMIPDLDAKTRASLVWFGSHMSVPSPQRPTRAWVVDKTKACTGMSKALRLVWPETPGKVHQSLPAVDYDDAPQHDTLTETGLKHTT